METQITYTLKKIVFGGDKFAVEVYVFNQSGESWIQTIKKADEHQVVREFLDLFLRFKEILSDFDQQVFQINSLDIKDSTTDSLEIKFDVGYASKLPFDSSKTDWMMTTQVEKKYYQEALGEQKEKLNLSNRLFSLVKEIEVLLNEHGIEAVIDKLSHQTEIDFNGGKVIIGTTEEMEKDTK